MASGGCFMVLETQQAFCPCACMHAGVLACLAADCTVHGPTVLYSNSSVCMVSNLVAPLESACRDGEDELYYNMLLEEDPWNKLQVQAVLSAVCLTASTVICWLCEKDPAGERAAACYAVPML